MWLYGNQIEKTPDRAVGIRIPDNPGSEGRLLAQRVAAQPPTESLPSCVCYTLFCDPHTSFAGTCVCAYDMALIIPGSGSAKPRPVLMYCTILYISSAIENDTVFPFQLCWRKSSSTRHGIISEGKRGGTSEISDRILPNFQQASLDSGLWQQRGPCRNAEDSTCVNWRDER